MNSSYALSSATIIIALCSLFLGFFLSYLILKKIEATDLMWFVYIMYLPFAIVAAVLIRILDGMKN